MNFEKTTTEPSAESEESAEERRTKERFAREREVLNEIMSSTHWEPVDGVAIGDRGQKFGDQGIEIMKGNNDPNEGVNQEGIWNQNGNVIALVAEGGKMFIAPASEALVKKLQESVLKKDENMGVPMSHGEVPVHPAVRERWDNATAEAAHEDKLAKEKRAAENPEGEGA
jgi:hypothetical protein